MNPRKLSTREQRRERKGVFTVFLLALMAASFNAKAVELPDLPKLIEENGKAVVNIRVDQNGLSQTSLTQPRLPNGEGLPEGFQHFFRGLPSQPAPQERHSVGIGSGFIISSDGYIVTNAHVVEEADEVQVIMKDRREFIGQVVGLDKRSDIALLKVDAKDLPTIRTGNSDKLKVGQWVFAIGAPFGFDQTATQGIVSALSRSLPDGTYVPFIQTDVAVNPGNSGGPLFDLDGNVVGVNSQIYSRSGGYMGLSFAIPINLVKNITAQIQNKGYVSRGWLGVGIQGMDASLAHSFKLDRPHGALVSEVDDAGPARKAGLMTGDVILSYNGKMINRANDLPALVGVTPVGSTVAIKVLRNGKEKTLRVTIAELESREPQKVALQQASRGALGVAVSELAAEEREKLGLKKKGILIEGVAPGSPASKAGLREGDVLLSFNNAEITRPEDLKEAARKAPANEPLAVLILRKDQPQFLSLQLQDKVS
jgi:serine protease Do